MKNTEQQVQTELGYLSWLLWIPATNYNIIKWLTFPSCMLYHDAWDFPKQVRKGVILKPHPEYGPQWLFTWTSTHTPTHMTHNNIKGWSWILYGTVHSQLFPHDLSIYFYSSCKKVLFLCWSFFCFFSSSSLWWRQDWAVAISQ